mmetsp:Transcript_9136/g.24626  ORF Transcript_9136/g.24626 Transcript_9136/m.24626 type:complete len:206 (+) Transcript_9136:1877-2494(+)
MHSLEAGQHILQGGGHKKVLLLQAQLLALGGGVVGVQHSTDGIGALASQHGLVIFASIECPQVKLFQGLGIPQAQVGAGGGAEARHRIVISHSPHLLSGCPHRLAVLLVHLATKGDLEAHVITLNLPWVAISQPHIRHLILVTSGAVHQLLEHAVLVTDAVAPAGKVQGCHGVQEASGQAPQATISESCVPLGFRDLLHLVAHLV